MARVEDLSTIGGSFELVVDRGCMHSLGGNRARSAFVDTVVRLTARGSRAYIAGWVPTASGRSRRANATARLGVALFRPDEIATRFGDTFDVELLGEVCERVSMPGALFIGAHGVTLASYWMTRR